MSGPRRSDREDAEGVARREDEDFDFATENFNIRLYRSYCEEITFGRLRTSTTGSVHFSHCLLLNNHANERCIVLAM